MILIVRCEKLMPSCACSRLIVIKISGVCEGGGWQWPILSRTDTLPGCQLCAGHCQITKIDTKIDFSLVLGECVEVIKKWGVFGSNFVIYKFICKTMPMWWPDYWHANNWHADNWHGGQLACGKLAWRTIGIDFFNCFLFNYFIILTNNKFHFQIKNLWTILPYKQSYFRMTYEN